MIQQLQISLPSCKGGREKKKPKFVWLSALIFNNLLDFFFLLMKWSAEHHQLACQDLRKAVLPAHNDAEHFKAEGKGGRCTPHKTTYTNTESAQGNTETTTAINTRTRVVVNVTGSLASTRQPLDPRTGKGGGNAWKSNATRARPSSPATGCTLD